VINAMITAKENVKIVQKSWGQEIWMANNEKENYCGKILEILPGNSTSLHFHALKHETFYVLEGCLQVNTVNTQTTEVTENYIEEGESFSLNRFIPHKLIAGDNLVKFVEISTHHKDEDSYRVIR
jgi:quercetin dioxygenase-like cupin family protein